MAENAKIRQMQKLSVLQYRLWRTVDSVAIAVSATLRYAMLWIESTLYCCGTEFDSRLYY